MHNGGASLLFSRLHAKSETTTYGHVSSCESRLKSRIVLEKDWLIFLLRGCLVPLSLLLLAPVSLASEQKESLLMASLGSKSLCSGSLERKNHANSSSNDPGANAAAAPPVIVSSREDDDDEVSQLTESIKTPTRLGRISAALYDYSVGMIVGNGQAPTVEEGDEDGDATSSDVAVELDYKSSSSFLFTPATFDFLNDDPKDMTWSRIIALKLMTKKWYNPHADSEKAAEVPNRSEHRIEVRPPTHTKRTIPSLAKAWAYFEHFALPRYIVNEKSQRGDLTRAEPGEDDLPTKLYDPIRTPLSQMGDFGIGIGLYFSTLLALTVMTALGGLLNIPNFIYYSSDDYSDGQPGVPKLQQGSAICTRQVWVPCPNCNFTDWERRNADDRFGFVETPTNGNLTFALHNDCEGATLQQGMISFGTLLLFLVGILCMNRYQKRKEVEFDEDEQTAQDYSIRIRE
jgi:hypothetical protein